jgi:hypothetical protein
VLVGGHLQHDSKHASCLTTHELCALCCRKVAAAQSATLKLTNTQTGVRMRVHLQIIMLCMIMQSGTGH